MQSDLPPTSSLSLFSSISYYIHHTKLGFLTIHQMCCVYSLCLILGPISFFYFLNSTDYLTCSPRSHLLDHTDCPPTPRWKLLDFICILSASCVGIPGTSHFMDKTDEIFAHLNFKMLKAGITSYATLFKNV